MDAQATPSFVYTNGNGHGNGNGENGNANSPLFLTGHQITRLTNDADGSRRDEIAAMLVHGEAQLVSPTLAQAAALTLSTIPRIRLAAALKGNDLEAKPAPLGKLWDDVIAPSLS